VVQSSSATTVAIVGFVSAGLMTFPQSLGALFGTNIGTTATGWLVALVGFKLQLSSIMLPVLFAGVMLRLFGRRRARDPGWALAGFALIFIGLDMLRGGMAAYEGVVTPADFPGDGLGGRLLLVLIGAGITLVTQSSSAGVATALTAVHSGAITFPQAAAMVIGMDVGTTATTLLATIGASPQTRRTGWSHVVYNVFTAVLALLLLDPYTSVIDASFAGGAAAHSELSLVGFHTTFNLVGVLVVLPFTGAFARLMMRLIPERGPRFTRRLDRALRVDAAAAVPALLRTVRDLSAELFATLADQLAAEKGGAADTGRLDVVDEALSHVRRYADDIHTSPRQQEVRRKHLGAMHALDHLDRLLDRCRQERAEGPARPAPIDAPHLPHRDTRRGVIGRAALRPGERPPGRGALAAPHRLSRVAHLRAPRQRRVSASDSDSQWKAATTSAWVMAPSRMRRGTSVSGCSSTLVSSAPSLRIWSTRRTSRTRYVWQRLSKSAGLGSTAPSACTAPPA
jgi:phosphate:Na+ symporter